jgi:dTDP-4-dehydrorhamnose 3,5-epimerase
MNFVPSPIAGAFIVEMEPVADERGFFARFWSREEFRAAGLNPNIEQNSISFNREQGTLRGLHYQAAPHEEVKLVRCTRGAIWDVIVDLRSDSSTFRRWFAVELTPNNGNMLYVPAGFAHGFQTLARETEVLYQISEAYHPELARGVRWNDPAFQIEWPIPNPILSPRDRQFADFELYEECRADRRDMP